MKDSVNESAKMAFWTSSFSLSRNTCSVDIHQHYEEPRCDLRVRHDNVHRRTTKAEITENRSSNDKNRPTITSLGRQPTAKTSEKRKAQEEDNMLQL